MGLPLCLRSPLLVLPGNTAIYTDPEDRPRMTQNRSLLIPGLALTLRRLPALLWAFLFNLVYGALGTFRTAGAIGRITDTSFAARPLHYGFDLGSLASLAYKMSESTNALPSFSTSIALYLATYFLLVPGTLLCYQTGAPARLSTLLSAGLTHFWRFLRISLLTLIVMALILGPLGVLQSKWADHVDEHIVGRSAFLYELAGIIVVALVAAILRLYFDLVEVYTVQLGLEIRPNGKPDRRVRKTLGPAFRALRDHFGRAYLTFVLLSAFGIVAVFLTTRATIHSLAQPRVWPMFLLSQLGLFLLLFARFWQRGAETALSLNHPIREVPVIRTSFAPRDPAPGYVPDPVRPPVVPAPLPDPEPSAPSLDRPDPGVYRHEPPAPARHPGDPDPTDL